MKSNTDHQEKIPQKIVRVIRSEPGLISEIARSVRRADGRRGVSHSTVIRVLDGKKRSRRVRAVILRKYRAIKQARAFHAIGRTEELVRRLAG
jgi:hypothetical protein